MRRRGIFKMVEKGRSAPSLSGTRCSVSVLLWIFLGFILIFHLISMAGQKDEEKQIQLNKFQFIREFEEIEEEDFQIPTPRGKRNPRALKRRGPRKQRSVIEEFLDESSDLRPYFFPDQKAAIGPTQESDSEKLFNPGKMWLDTDGKPIQAHGGGILFDERSEIYYWYGENKDGPTYHSHSKGSARVDVIGISCYSSMDLWTWKNEGIVLPGEAVNPAHDLHLSKVLERPKVIYNDQTHNYVMWMHIDDGNYTKASVGVAVSDSPVGPFKYLFSKRPHNCDSRDMTVFKDDDGMAYIIYSSDENSELHVSPLTGDYVDVTDRMRRILIGQHREAPAVFKHGGTYYMITSGCSGWLPNRAMAHAAEIMMGMWETIGTPCVGGNKVLQLTTFFAQGTFVVPLSRLPGVFVFMADRWNPAELRDSRYVWLPLIVAGVADEPLEYNFGFPVWSKVSIFWHRRWRLPDL